MIVPYVLTALVYTGCDAWVEDVEPPRDEIVDALLTDESQVDFLIKGIESRFATSYTRVALYASGLSDELIYSPDNDRAVFAFEPPIDVGDPGFDNVFVSEMHADIGELRYLADQLLFRMGRIEFADQNLKARADFAGRFYGGVARYFLGTYFGLTQHEGGGVITEDPESPGPFIPAPEMYRLALNKLDEAKAFADAPQVRLINTLVARINLFEGRYDDARAAASIGLQMGDPAFESLHANDFTAVNRFWSQAGPGNYGWTFDPVFHDFVVSDPNEANRIPMTELTTERDDSVHVFYGQDRYRDRSSPHPFATWQENELMLAELDLRDGNGGGALTRINAVRASHGIDPLETANMSSVELERRKELWSLGLRLPDQRRFNSWHLEDGTWVYFPIPRAERDINPNL